MRNTRRKRSPTKREIRERDRAISDSSRAFNNVEGAANDWATSEKSSFVTKRRVNTAELNPLGHPVIKELLADGSNEMAHRKVEPGASLLSAADASRVARVASDSANHLMALTLEFAEGRPDELTGRLGAVAIFGARRTEPGPRFIGFALGRHSGSLGEKLKVERSALVDHIGAQDILNAGRTPHISLYKTHDQEQAEHIAQKLRNTGIIGEPIALGPVTVNPVQLNLNTRPDTIRS